MDIIKALLAIFIISVGVMFIFGFIFRGLSELHKESSTDFEAQHEKKVQYKIHLKPISNSDSRILEVQYVQFGEDMVGITYEGKNLLIPYCSIGYIEEK